MSGIVGYFLSNVGYSSLRRGIEVLDVATIASAVKEGYITFSISRRLYGKTFADVLPWMVLGSLMTVVASKKRSVEWVNVLTLHPDLTDYRLAAVPVAALGVTYLFKRGGPNDLMAPLTGLAAGGLIARYFRYIK